MFYSINWTIGKLMLELKRKKTGYKSLKRKFLSKKKEMLVGINLIFIFNNLIIKKNWLN